MNLDFCIIGVQKSATTWLHHCLSEHPEVFIGGAKNESYYYQGPVFREKGEAWFWSLFENFDNEKVVGNASVDYIYNSESIKALCTRWPKIKLIMAVRNPYDRAISAYHWLYRQNLIADISLEEGLLKAVDDYKNEKTSEDQAHEMIGRSLYYNQLMQIEPFLNHIKVVTFDEVQEAPADTLRLIYSHLGVDREFRPLNLLRKPKKDAKLKMLHVLQRKAKSKIAHKLINAGNEIFGQIRSRKPKVPDNVYNQMADVLGDDIYQLKRMLKERDLLFNPGAMRFIDRWH
jgi:hypothetical protein